MKLANLTFKAIMKTLANVINIDRASIIRLE